MVTPPFQFVPTETLGGPRDSSLTEPHAARSINATFQTHPESRHSPVLLLRVAEGRNQNVMDIRCVLSVCVCVHAFHHFPPELLATGLPAHTIYSPHRNQSDSLKPRSGNISSLCRGPHDGLCIFFVSLSLSSTALPLLVPQTSRNSVSFGFHTSCFAAWEAPPQIPAEPPPQSPLVDSDTAFPAWAPLTTSLVRHLPAPSPAQPLLLPTFLNLLLFLFSRVF